MHVFCQAPCDQCNAWVGAPYKSPILLLFLLGFAGLFAFSDTAVAVDVAAVIPTQGSLSRAGHCVDWN